MTNLEIQILAQNIELCFAYFRDNATFNLSQRREWLIQGIEQRRRLMKLIGKELSQSAEPKVIEANDKLKAISQRLEDKLESLRQFANTIQQITDLVVILDVIVGLVAPVPEAALHSTVKSPDRTGFQELLVTDLTTDPTKGYFGNAPSVPFLSSDNLLVKGRGSVTELTMIPTGVGNIIPPYATSRIRPESIIGEDNRVRILDTQNSPWRMICSLSIAGPRINAVGTGWFVGPKTIITAGHCIYEERQMGGWATQITVNPGRDGNELPFRPIVSDQFEVPEEWIESRGMNPDYDYGVIHLDTPIGEETGWFSVTAARDEELRAAFVNLSGYPGDRTGGFGIYQLFHSDQVANVSENRFFYAIDTFGGQSGSPVWVELDDGRRQAVGIHTYGVGGSFSLNSATRITPIILNDVRRWLEEARS